MQVPSLTIRQSLSVTLLSLIFLIAGLILVISARGDRQTVDDMLQLYLTKAGELVEKELENFFAPVRTNLRNGREWSARGVFDRKEVEAANAVFMPLLGESPQVTSIATGEPDGYSYRLGIEENGFLNRIIDPARPGTARYSLWTSKGVHTRTWDEASDYDARTRPWYTDVPPEFLTGGAAGDAEIFWSSPFVLHTSRLPGIAASLPYRTPAGTAYVMSFNLMLTKVMRFTSSLRPSPGGVAFVLSSDGRVIGFPASDQLPTQDSRVAWIRGHGNQLPSLEELGLPELAGAVQLWNASDGRPASVAVRSRSAGEVWWTSFRPFPLGPGVMLWIGMAIPERDLTGQASRHRATVLSVSAAALLVAVILAAMLATAYGTPLSQLAARSRRITRLDLSGSLPIRTHVLETQQLAETHDQMRNALDAFSRYVPAEVVRELLRRGEAAQLGGRRADVTVLFTDIRGFTGISEMLSPEDLAAHLSVYFENMMRFIREEQGEVDKLIGDAIMAIWGAPIADPDQARNAVRTCLRCREFLAAFNADCERDGRPPLRTGFGLDCGEVMVGNFGAPSRLTYTVVGDTVNLASRLEGSTKFFGVEIIASEAVRRAAGEEFVWRLIDVVAVKGRRQAVRIYEPLGWAGQVPDEQIEFSRRYEAAFDAYHAREFATARRLFAEALAINPHDASALRLSSACERYAIRPPADDWDGAVRLDGK